LIDIPICYIDAILVVLTVMVSVFTVSDCVLIDMSICYIDVILVCVECDG